MISKLKLCFLFAALSAVTVSQALATGTPPPPPAPTPPSSSTSGAEAAAAAAAKAQAGAVAGAHQGQGQQQGQGQGQQMGQDQSATSGASLTDNSQGGSYRSSMWVLPAPVFTPPLPAIPCPSANADQLAFAVGFNFISFAKASTNSDNCTAITLYNSYVATCKYASAQQVLDRLSSKVLPGFTPSGIALVDIEASKCRDLLAPVTNVTNNYYETIYQPPAPPAIVEKKPVVKQRVKTKLPCEKVLVDKKVYQCKAKKG